jgi:predicted small lipoprotein YifL
MTRLPALTLAALALLLAGCGQKGPLYLPDDASATSTDTPAAEQRPAEE